MELSLTCKVSLSATTESKSVGNPQGLPISLLNVGALFLALQMSCLSVQAADLDGRTAVKYETASYAFSDGDWARGFVRLNAGFSVPAAGTVSMNVLTPVEGVIDLNDTGIIKLEGDLSLASNATLPDGGVIDGQGKAVFLNGDMTIPAGKIIECTSDTIIDGQGHTLFFADDGEVGGQLYINGAAGTKVTLRNITLRGIKDVDGISTIRVSAASNQRLILENVKMYLGGDVLFWNGNIEIKGFVEIHGFYYYVFLGGEYLIQPAAFYWFSSGDLIVDKDSTLYLDLATAFVYLPFDYKNTHLKFTDSSSRLFMDGAALYTDQQTGLALTKGHLIVDHKSFLQSDGATKETAAFELGKRSVDINLKYNSDLFIDIMPAAQLRVTDGCVRYYNIN